MLDFDFNVNDTILPEVNSKSIFCDLLEENGLSCAKI